MYASVLGVVWACIAYRWQLSMPGIVTGSLQVTSKTSTGLAMFSVGLFMAQQEKFMACGAELTVLGMVLRIRRRPARHAGRGLRARPPWRCAAFIGMKPVKR